MQVMHVMTLCYGTHVMLTLPRRAKCLTKRKWEGIASVWCVKRKEMKRKETEKLIGKWFTCRGESWQLRDLVLGEQ